MLALHPSTSTKRLTPNLLPCAIKHNGPIPIHPRYWSPTTTTSPGKPNGVSKTQTSTSYFRGRKLHGRHIPLPPGYEGVVLTKTNTVLPTHSRTDGNAAGGGASMADRLRAMEGERLEDEDEEDSEIEREEPLEVKTMEQMARFDEIVVWGHEALPEEEADEFVRGVGEWVGFAEAMHSHDSSPSTKEAVS